jgi:DNA polymerase-2
VFDFASLYPSIIRTFQIDPLGWRPDPAPDDDSIVAPNGAAFRREPGILPSLLDELFPRREAAKREGNAAASQAIKILMNSFYGVLGTPVCRFAAPALANAITGFGREILLWSKAWFEAAGFRVLYGDTDSLFVESARDDEEGALALGEELAPRLDRELAAHVERTWRVESRLRLEFETLYLRLLLPVARGSTAGARKRYVGLERGSGEPRVVFTGMEVVRRDWTELAKRVQRELYARLFDDRPVDDYLFGIVEELRSGAFDDLLVYRKSLRKRLDSYTANTPPHVAAARKMSRPPRRTVEYVITENGPEPAAERKSSLDREHYVQKQVRAVAEPVLTLLELDFDRIVGDDRQLDLF